METQSAKERFHLFRVRVFGDQHSFEVLLKEKDTGERIRRYLYTKFPTRQDAEDAYSTVCMRVWDYATRNNVEHFSGLMGSVAKSCIAEFYRNRDRRPYEVPMETDDYTIPIESKNSGQKISEYVDGELMKKAMQELDEDECEIITLKYFEGYSMKEIGDRFGKTENAASVSLHRALKKLREIIEKK